MGCMSGVSCVYMRMGATHSGQMILLLTMRNEKLHHDNRAEAGEPYDQQDVY